MEVKPAPERNVEFVFGEVTSPAAVEAFVKGCTSIIHLAGIAHTSLRTEAEKRRSYLVNVEGTRAVWVPHCGTMCGASYLYRLLMCTQIAAASVLKNPAVESDASNYYAFTKIKAERLVGDAAGCGMEVVIARPCRSTAPECVSILERMMRGIDRAITFIFRGVNPMRSFLSIENAARALAHFQHREEFPPAFTISPTQIPIHWWTSEMTWLIECSGQGPEPCRPR